MEKNKEFFKNFFKTFSSFFSGIGGFDKPAHEKGMSCITASEIDKYANQSYEILYNMKTVGDITKVKAEDVPTHDVLLGGFPCQAFSIAGRKLGFEDARGTLFFEIARIAKEKKPKVMLLENVKNLLSHNNYETITVICQIINEIGYYVDINIVNSKYFLPQQRERVFFTCVRKDLIDKEKWEIKNPKKAIGKTKLILENAGIEGFNFAWPEQTTLAPHVSTILEQNADIKYYIHKKHIQEFVSNLPIERFPMGLNVLNPTADGHSKCLTTRSGGQYNYHTTIKKHNAIVMTNRIKKEDIQGDFISFLDEKSIDLHDGTVLFMRRLTPLETFLLQGFSKEDFDKLKDHISDTQLYKQAGNAVSVPVIKGLLDGFEKLNYKSI